MNRSSAALAYARVGVETGVEGSDPRRLIVMLYDGALASLREARAHMVRRDTAAKGRALARALRIIDEGLVASLDSNAGGDIARQLRDLYGYISQRLTLANVRNDPALIDEADRLLSELRGAWAAPC
jgi:flagellar protein FliS